MAAPDAADADGADVLPRAAFLKDGYVKSAELPPLAPGEAMRLGQVSVLSVLFLCCCAMCCVRAGRGDARARARARKAPRSEALSDDARIISRHHHQRDLHATARTQFLSRQNKTKTSTGAAPVPAGRVGERARQVDDASQAEAVE